LAEADQSANATPFIEFMLGALYDAIREYVATDQVTEQVATLMQFIGSGELGTNDLMKALGLSHKPTFRKNYIGAAIEGGWVERTQPNSPRSPTKRYRLTGKGRHWLQLYPEK